MNQERRFIAMLVGIGATALSMLSKLTIPLGLPGGVLSVLVQKVTPSIVVSQAALWIGNFVFCAVGTYLYLGWRSRRAPAA